MDIDAFIHGTTSLLTIASVYEEHAGTGFFYHQIGDTPIGPDKQIIPIEKIWLISNRHVILGDFPNESIPDKVTFKLRKVLPNNSLSWDDIVISRPELTRRSKVHPDAVVDLIAIDVLDKVVNRVKELDKLKMSTIAPIGVNKINLQENNNKLRVEISDPCLILGYPQGSYDESNLYPIVKSASISSSWGQKYDGLPYFLIDSRLFEGASGSLVISKPTNIIAAEKRLFYSQEKQFLLLGVYSGFHKKMSYMGMVWYASLVEEIITDGIPINIK